MRFVNKNSLIHTLYHTAVPYPGPSNLNYIWSFGIFLLVCLIIQILTGIFLAMHYVPNIDLAFVSVEHIMRDVNFGWLLRYIHANGASMFFISVYLHICRGLYYSSYTYPRQLLWCIGVIIFLLMIITAFLGYVLPWGQMSFWGATVITNLASAVPYVGNSIVFWLWGGFSVDNATLNRFFSFHYLLPFIIAALTVVHMIFLHDGKSNNPLGIDAITFDNVPFTPYFVVKDLFAVILFFVFFCFFIFYLPNYLGHTDNYIPANPLVTPAHIVPEWYLLPFYAILRSVPDKLGGVILMLSSILIFLILPFIHNIQVRSMIFRPASRVLFWIFFFDSILLGWIGGSPVEVPYYQIGQLCSIIYFGYFFILIHLFNYYENSLSINSQKIKPSAKTAILPLKNVSISSEFTTFDEVFSITSNATSVSSSGNNIGTDIDIYTPTPFELTFALDIYESSSANAPEISNK